MRDLTADPAWKEIDLGMPLPDSLGSEVTLGFAPGPDAGPAAGSGHVTRSNFSAMASVMKRVRPAYMCLSPPPDCCVT